jgi:hypothetical protein
MITYYRKHIALGVLATLALLVLGISLADDVAALFRHERETRLVCGLADVSGSTKKARKRYGERWRLIALDQSLRDGRVCFAAVAGSADEIEPVPRSLAAENPANSSDAELERRQKVLAVAKEFDALLRKPPTTVPGSALIEALSMVGGKMTPGDAIHVFSDGLQASEVMTLRRIERTGAGIEQALDRLDRRRLLPDLSGVRVVFALPDFRPGGSVVTPEETRAFWTAWAQRTNADLTWGAI